MALQQEISTSYSCPRVGHKEPGETKRTVEARLSLEFAGMPASELVLSAFTHPLLRGSQMAIRGKTPGAHFGYGTFQWSRAVQAFSLLAVQTAAVQFAGTGHSKLPILSGLSGSLAASLGYAIEKSPAWLHDVFGSDSAGASLARRLFLRSNGSLKRSGPVSIALNPSILPSCAISVALDGRALSTAEQFEELIGAIEQNVVGRPCRAACQ